MDILVVIRVRNPERLAEFYSAIGLNFSLEKHGGGPLHYASSIGNSVFEICPLNSDTQLTIAVRLGFSVDDIDVSCKRAVEKSGRLIKEPTKSNWGRRAIISDPEGHVVDLFEK